MKKWLFGLLVLLFAAIGLITQLKIKKLSCETDYAPCPNYYVERLHYLVGKSWVFLPKKSEIKSALDSYTEIADVNFGRKFPNTLNIKIKLHAPVGTVNDYLVDDSGQVLAVASSSNLPRLVVPDQILPGNKLKSEQIAAIGVLNTLTNVFPNVISASLSGQILQFALNQTEVVFDVNALPNSYSDSLQLIFTRSKVEGTAPKKVDMRFNNPIIVY